MRGLRGLVADAQDKVKMFSAKVHKTGGQVLVACCDAEILGRTLKSGELEIRISESFYGGQKVDEKSLMDLMKEATTVNLMGDKVVSLALSEGIIDESGIMDVCGIKHAQLFSL